MTDNWYDALPRPAYSNFKKISTSEDWFEVYEIAANLFVFYEKRHYEETISNLVIGQKKAALIDTGCGIGNLRRAVEEVTDKPVMVINTHTHLDHLGGNRQFDEIAMFDHPLSLRVAHKGAAPQIVRTEILEESLVIKPWPPGFDPDGFSLPPFKVSRWLTDGDRINLGDRDLEVIHTPGEAVDHICLLDRADRILFCGDILVHGSVWTHLEGGSLKELITSYRRLMSYFDDFDHLMPGHNEPWLDKNLLPESLAGAEKVVSGQAEYREIIDPWNRRLRQYPFDQFTILTRVPDGNPLEKALQTDRLLLEPLCEHHAQYLFPLLSDPQIYTFIPQDPPASLAELQIRYRQLQTRHSPEGDQVWLNWAIYLKAEQHYVGIVQTTIGSDQTGYLAYELHPRFWGCGYATEACRQIIETLFTDHQVTEIIAEVDTRNVASYKLLERLSFERVMVKEQADFFKGRYSDEYVYRLKCQPDRSPGYNRRQGQH